MAVTASYQNAARYRQTQAQTASPTHLVVMLYDGAIRFLTVAQEKMKTGEIEQRHRNLIRAQKIVAELMSSLDMQNGGEVAANLQRIYSFMLRELVDANVNDRPEPIARVVQQLRSLRESWAEVDRMQKRAVIAQGETDG